MYEVAAYSTRWQQRLEVFRAIPCRFLYLALQIQFTKYRENCVYTIVKFHFTKNMASNPIGVEFVCLLVTSNAKSTNRTDTETGAGIKI